MGPASDAVSLPAVESVHVFILNANRLKPVVAATNAGSPASHQSFNRQDFGVRSPEGGLGTA